MQTSQTPAFDRSTEDMGNIVHLEHVNLKVPDQRLATLFYVSGLGLTRDPYMMTGVDNMWVNAGRTQFHLPTGQPQRLRGHVGLVVPDHDALRARLQAVQPLLAGTAFSVVSQEGRITACCPWGNTIACLDPERDPAWRAIGLGIAYVAFDVPAGTATAIARFYREVFAAPATVQPCTDAPLQLECTVRIGSTQCLRFRETPMALVPYDGHHIQIYVADFGGPHRRLLERGLVTEESNRHQYRFEEIRDNETGVTCIHIEHEVRSLTHPLYARPLVNRNPRQSNRDYRPGRDAFTGA